MAKNLAILQASNHKERYYTVSIVFPQLIPEGVIDTTDNCSYSQGAPRVNLDNIDIDKPQNGRSWAKIIDSPRSLEAFKRAGIYARELDPVDINSLESALKRRFGTQAVNQDILFLRLEHANKNRQVKFNMVKSVSWYSC